MKKLFTVILAGLILAICVPGLVKAEKKVDLKKLDNYIKNAVKEHDLTGLSVLIVKYGEVLFKKGYGTKNIETGEKMDTGAIFNIASVTKAFTAASIGILVDEGKLSWNDKIVDLIPEFKLADPYITQEMNLIDILSHRSGLGTFYGDLLWYQTDYSNEEIITRMRYLPLTREYRSEYGYQNNMFSIAGEIIEKVTGMKWEDFIQTRIFNPLGFSESRPYSRLVTPDQNIAYPHLDHIKQEIYMAKPWPAGSIYSNVEDMGKWMIMLLNGGEFEGKQVLPRNVIEEQFTPRTLNRVSASLKDIGINFNTYGLGWALNDYAGKLVATHGGGMPGYLSRIALVPDENLGFIILTNDDNSLYSALRYKILDLFLTDRDRDWSSEFLERERKSEVNATQEDNIRENSRKLDTTPSLALEDFTGIYTDKMYGNAEITFENGTLNLTLLPAKEVFTSNMEHWHFDTFRIKFKDEFLPEGFVTFSFNTDREIIGFKIDLPNPDFHFFNLNFKKIEK